MASPSLPLSGIVNISVSVNPQSALPPAYNTGLIVGSTGTGIPSVGANSRVRTYSAGTWSAAMLTDGYTTSSPEYIAAQLYFSQSPAPFQLQVGRQNLTAIIAAAIAAPGSGYAVGDTGTISGGTAGKLATYQVTTIGAAGAVTGLAITSGGDGYTAAVGAATTATSGSGSALTVTTTGDVGETPLIAITACRVASNTWWGATVCGATTADAEAIVAYFQGLPPGSFYFHTTSDAAVLNGLAGNLGVTLKAASYTRAMIDYATTQGGAAPNNVYACAAALGVAMGLNTGLAGSNFTLKFKLLTGIVAEPLTASQIAVIEGNNVNLYLGYQGPYTILEQGTTPLTNTFVDEILNRDMLVGAMQTNVMNLLTASPSVPQTDPGETQLIHAVNQACQAAVTRGYLAPGTWTGPPINVSATVGLNPGDPVPAGYKAMAAAYSTQSSADRAARKAMPIYCAITEAGAVHSLVIGVYIQQ